MDKKLSAKQRSAIDLLLQGLSDREVAEKIGVRRETVNGWRNHHPVFIAEFEKARKELFGGRVQETEKELLGENTINKEIELIKQVNDTDLLTLEGIEARFRLVDSLLLIDIIKCDERRTKVIQRLQMNVETVRDYVATILTGKSLNDSVAILVNKYKFIHNSTLKDVLYSIVGEENAKRVLTTLAQKMDLIEGEKGLTNAENETTNN